MSDILNSPNCFKCEKNVDLAPGKILGRHEDCDHCGSDLRVCMMCTFYDKKSYNECREPVAERIVEKEKANYCDFFKLRSADGEDSSKEDSLADANALFKI